MKTNIFTRILLATLLPMLLVFLLVISTINNVIYGSGANFARETAALSARQVSRQLSYEMEVLSNLLKVVSRGMYNMPFDNEEARIKPAEAIDALLDAAPAIHSTCLRARLLPRRAAFLQNPGQGQRRTSPGSF